MIYFFSKIFKNMNGGRKNEEYNGLLRYATYLLCLFCVLSLQGNDGQRTRSCCACSRSRTIFWKVFFGSRLTYNYDTSFKSLWNQGLGTVVGKRGGRLGLPNQWMHWVNRKRCILKLWKHCSSTQRTAFHHWFHDVRARTIREKRDFSTT